MSLSRALTLCLPFLVLLFVRLLFCCVSRFLFASLLLFVPPFVLLCPLHVPHFAFWLLPFYCSSSPRLPRHRRLIQLAGTVVHFEVKHIALSAAFYVVHDRLALWPSLLLFVRIFVPLVSLSNIVLSSLSFCVRRLSSVIRERVFIGLC